MKIVIVKNSEFWKKTQIKQKNIKNIVNVTLNAVNFQNKCELSVILCDNDFIAKYNSEFRSKNKPTNVLSFPSGEFSENLEKNQAIYLGDIMFAYQIILDESKEQNKSFENHFTHLLIHGVLHLLNFDHITKKDREVMEKMEIEILKEFRIENPYIMK